MNARGVLLLAGLMSVCLISYAKADDPCMDDLPKVKHLTTSLPPLSADDVKAGTFEVDDLSNNGGEKAIVVNYRLNGKKVFQQKVVGNEEITDNMSMAATRNKGNGALRVNFMYGMSGAV